MTGPRRKYDASFREEAVQLVLPSDPSVMQVADELGVNESTLGNWTVANAKGAMIAGPLLPIISPSLRRAVACMAC
ncbi:transposase [Arthrobacter sp. R3-55]